MKSIGKRIANRVLSSTPSADAGAAQFLRSYTHALDWDIDADNAESANAVAAKGFLQSFAASYDWGQDAKPAEALVEQFLIAPDDFVEGLVGLAQQSIRNGAPDVARSVAFSLLETPLMREAGAVMLGVVACARKLWPFASDNFGMCSDETLIRYQFANAVSPNQPQLQKFKTVLNAKRSKNQPSLPSTIGTEKAINPFLNCNNPTVASTLENQFETKLNSETEIFALLRRWKDSF